MSIKLSLEETISKTMEILGITNPKEVAYITTDLLNQAKVFEESCEVSQSTQYGHKMFFCHKDGDWAYCFFTGDGDRSSIANACGDEVFTYLKWKNWDIENTGEKCTKGGDDEGYLITKFIKK